MDAKMIRISNKEYSSLSQLAREHHLNIKTVDDRYRRGKRGKDLIKPIHRRYKVIDFQGHATTFVKLSGMTGLPANLLQRRYRNGARDEWLVRPKNALPEERQHIKSIIVSKLAQEDDIAPLIQKIRKEHKLTENESTIYWRAYKREYGHIYRHEHHEELLKYWRDYYQNHT